MEMFRDSRYKLFQDSLDSQMKCLTRAGHSKQRKQAKPITEVVVLGDNEAKTLVNTLVYGIFVWKVLCSS